MTIHLPEELERYVRNEVQCGHFASADEVITEAVRLLRQRMQAMVTTALPLTEDEFEQRLKQSGFLDSNPQQATAARREFQPVPIAGEPLSETVIGERR